MNLKQRLDAIAVALERLDVDAVREWLDTLTPRQRATLRRALEIDAPHVVTGFEHLTDEELDAIIYDGLTDEHLRRIAHKGKQHDDKMSNRSKGE